jgi:aspartate/methionine/tyrosine aminotransferase
MTLPPSLRSQVPPFLIMEALSEANRFAASSSHRILHMSLGQPSREVPMRVREAVAERMRSATLGYTEAGGMEALRFRIVRYYAERYGLKIGPERIFVTLGSSAAFLTALLAWFDAGDEVAIAQPCYPAYPNTLQALNLTPVFLRGDASNRFQPTPAALASLPGTPRGLITASPSNPAGTVLKEGEMKALAQYCAAQGIRLIADEIYQGIAYGERPDDRPGTMLAHTDQAIVVNSFSKYFLMPGWRIGWAVVPPQLAGTFSTLSGTLFISPSAIAQYAALEVMECEAELDAVVQDYARNRSLLLEALPAMGIDQLAPAEGGFFIYADLRHLTEDSVAFCRRMLHETGVVAVPGVDFDQEEGKYHVRFSYSGAHEEMMEALERLKGWLGR